jgi:hypothetical protein
MSASIITIEDAAIRDQKSAPLISIELPCFVSSSAKAIELIGGAAHLTACINKNWPITCELSNHPFQKRIIGSESNCNEILVKLKRTIRRRKKVGNSNPNIIDVSNVDDNDEVVIKESSEVLGIVTTKWNFDRPFDAQVI